MASSGDASKYKWAELTSMPTKRVFATPLELDGKLYVIGGCDARGQPVDNMEVFDPAKNKWTRLQNMPTKRAGTCAVGVGNKVIAMGGVRFLIGFICRVVTLVKDKTYKKHPSTITFTT
jgi:N-acetylneuraminic acid mutarotase